MSIEKARITLCNLEKSDYDQVKQLMDEAYPDLGGAWPSHTIFRLIDQFPEGQIGVKDGERIVGIALSVQVDYQTFSNPHTYEDIVDAHSRIFSDSNADALYGLDVVYRQKSSRAAVRTPVVRCPKRAVSSV